MEEGKAVDHIIHMEERIIDLLKSLKNQNKISEKKYNLYPSDSKPGLGKIHKSLEDGIPTFRPILSATQSVFTRSKLTIETTEQDVKLIKVNNKDTRTTPNGVFLVSLLLTLNIFQTLF